MVEQRPFKPKVVGSIPTAPTSFLFQSTGLAESARQQKAAFRAGMRWSVGNSEQHGWHANAYPLKFLGSLRIVDSGVDAEIGSEKRQAGTNGSALEGEPQTALDPARSTQRVRACSRIDARASAGVGACPGHASMVHFKPMLARILSKLGSSRRRLVLGQYLPNTAS